MFWLRSFRASGPALAACVAAVGCATQNPTKPGVPPPSSLSLFSDGRPDKRLAAVPAQLAELEAFAVPIAVDRPSAIPVGLGLGSAAYQEPIRSTLMRIEALAGYQFDWQFSTMLPDGAMSFPGGIIVVNPGRLQFLSPDGAFIALMHEAGHHVLGHASPGGVVVGMQQPWLRPQFELDADCWAARRLAGAGNDPSRVLMAAMETFGGGPGDATHPPGFVRIGKIRNCLQAP